jgi:serine/threonine protein kinase
VGRGFEFELEVLEEIRRNLKGYAVLRSAALEADERAYEDRRRRPAEVDFVVAGPNGLFLLEAKWRDSVRGAFHDRWVYKQRDDDLSEAGESELMFKMKVNLIAAGRRVRQKGKGRFHPFENATGIFVFPDHAEIDLHDAAGAPLRSFDAGMFHIARLSELRALLEGLPPPCYGGPGSARAPLLTSDQAWELGNLFEGGVRPTPNVSVGFRVLDARKNYEIAANGLPFAVCRLEDGMGKRRRGKWYDMSALAEGDRSEFEERVRRHGRVIADASPHPNLLTYHKFEVDVLGHGYWVIEDDVDAESLASRLDRGAPLDAREVLRGIATGLKAIHTAKYVVRDLRPESVLIRRADGTVVLTNFECAKSLKGLRSVIATDWAFEADAYRAPEVQLGKEIDARADVYSWSAIAFRLLTGQVFLRVDQLQALAAPAVVPTVPKAIRDLVRQGLNVEPRERPNLDALLGALKTWR